MLRLFILISVLLGGLLVGPDLSDNKGYILISVDSYTTYETTLIKAAMIALIFYFLLLFAEWILRKLFSMSSITRGWFGHRKTNKAQKNSLLGMLTLFEGDSQKAQKLLASSAAHSGTPVLTYIAAAKAAQQQQKYDLRDEYLQQANDSEQTSQLAVGLIWAKLQIEALQYHQAEETLQALSLKYPKNGRIHELYALLYPALDEWQKYIDLINNKRNGLTFTDSEFSTIQLNAYQQLFKQLAAEDAQQLKEYWDNKAPRWMRKELDYQKAVLDAFLDAGEDKFAEQFLIMKLNKQFSLPLLAYLQRLEVSDYYPLILLLEKKLKKEPNAGIIHKALATLMLKENKIGAAIEHLKESVKSEANIEDFALLADLLEKDDRSSEAQQYYRRGLSLALSS